MQEEKKLLKPSSLKKKNFPTELVGTWGLSILIALSYVEGIVKLGDVGIHVDQLSVPHLIQEGASGDFFFNSFDDPSACIRFINLQQQLLWEGVV